MDTRQREIGTFEQRMSEPGFWDRPDDARRTVAALKHAIAAARPWNHHTHSLNLIPRQTVLL